MQHKKLKKVLKTLRHHANVNPKQKITDAMLIQTQP